MFVSILTSNNKFEKLNMEDNHGKQVVTWSDTCVIASL